MTTLIEIYNQPVDYCKGILIENKVEIPKSDNAIRTAVAILYYNGGLIQGPEDVRIITHPLFIDLSYQVSSVEEVLNLLNHNTKLYEWLCRGDHKDIIRKLRAYDFDEYSPRPNLEDCLRTACQTKSISIVRMLVLDMKVTPNEDCIDMACESTESTESTELFDIFFKEGKVDPSLHDNTAIKTACTFGSVDFVEFLLQDVRVDPLENDSFGYACRSDNVEVIRLLLNDYRYRDFKVDGYLEALCKNGSDKILRFLFEEKFFEPDNDIFEFAISYGLYEIAILFYSTGDIDPSGGIKTACASKFYNQEGMHEIAKLVEILIKDKRVDLTDCDICLRSACDNNNTDVVRLLLKDGRIDPRNLHHEYLDHQGRQIPYLVYACYAGLYDIVDLFIDDPRFNDWDGYNLCYDYAIYYNHLNIVKLLLTKGKIDVSKITIDYVNDLESKGHEDLVVILLPYVWQTCDIELLIKYYKKVPLQLVSQWERVRPNPAYNGYSQSISDTYGLPKDITYLVDEYTT